MPIFNRAETDARRAAIFDELAKRFEAEGFTVENPQKYVLEVNRRIVVIDEQTSGDSWHRTRNGKLFVRFDAADYKTLRFQEKAGKIDYDAVVVAFKQVLVDSAARRASEQEKMDLGRSIYAFAQHNQLPNAIQVTGSPALSIKVACNDFEQMQRIALAVKAILAED